MFYRHFIAGKPSYGFWSLMKLLQPDQFDPARSRREQLPHLAMPIRNAKQKVTDMKGARCSSPFNSFQTYQLPPEEERFHQLLTGFIQLGKAYALSLEKADAQPSHTGPDSAAETCIRSVGGGPVRLATTRLSPV